MSSTIGTVFSPVLQTSIVLCGTGTLTANVVPRLLTGSGSLSAKAATKPFALIWWESGPHQLAARWRFFETEKLASVAGQSLGQNHAVVDIRASSKSRDGRTFDSEAFDEMIRALRLEAKQGAAMRLRQREHPDAEHSPTIGHRRLDRDEEILRLREQGLSLYKISQQVNMTAPGVSAALRRLARTTQ